MPRVNAYPFVTYYVTSGLAVHAHFGAITEYASYRISLHDSSGSGLPGISGKPIRAARMSISTGGPPGHLST